MLLCGDSAGGSQVLDRPALAAQLGLLERDALADDLWEDQARAQALLKEIAKLKDGVAAADGLTSLLEDARAALEMAEQEARALPHTGLQTPLEDLMCPPAVSRSPDILYVMTNTRVCMRAGLCSGRGGRDAAGGAVRDRRAGSPAVALAAPAPIGGAL